jgi:hypothetical protein
MLHTKNLTREEVHQGIAPWEFKPATPIPEEVRKDKKRRDQWITNPYTEHHVYTFIEGVIPNCRVTAPKNGGEGNPARAIHALVADYDQVIPKEEVLQRASKMTWKPNWVERTLSGHWRLVWLMAEPQLFPSHDFAKHFLKTFKDFGFDPSFLLPGFDKGAWEAPDRLYTNSCEWYPVHNKPIPSDVSRGWLVKASQSFDFKKGFGTIIPLDIVRDELQKLYPRFIDWPGEFVLGSQGPTFWVHGSDSLKSAIVRETGMQTFAAHAVKGFYPWADLLGIDFCKKYEAEVTGRAVQGIYHDGKHYHRRLPTGAWKGFDKGDTINHLVTARGVSSKANNNGTSEVHKCLEHIHSYQSVSGAAPCIYRPEGLIHQGRELPLLNTSNVKVMQPLEGPGIWGPDGNFPWLSFWLDHYFTTPEQLRYKLAWLAWAYQHAFRGEPVSGQAVIEIGGVGTGKTLFGEGVLGRIMGGSVDACRYLLGEDKFGSQIFHAPIWLINDGTVATDPAKHRLFTEMVKRAVANREHEFHKKFGVPTMVSWLGRVFITGNDDEESIRIIPNLGQSNIDKMMIFRVVAKPAVKFPSSSEITKTLDRELPAFCAFLRDHKIPNDLIGDSRFGIKCYNEPSLVRTSIQSSENAWFGEILGDWKHHYFNVSEPKAEVWKGTAFQLLKAFACDASAEAIVRKLSVDAVGRHLAGLKSKGANIEVDDSGPTRIWIIHREDKR